MVAGLETFLIAALILNVTPGADMAFVLANAVSRGRKAGLVAALGIGVGGFGHTLAAALGLSALISLSADAFLILKLVGAAYLVWLAIQAVRGRGSLNFNSNQPARGIFRTFMDAALVNILNPKVALFMLAFLPQFIDPAAGNPAVQILMLGGIFCLSGTMVLMLVAWFAGAFSASLRSHSGAQRTLQWITVGILGGLGVRLGLMDP